MLHLSLSDIPSEVIRSELCETVEKKLESEKYKLNVSLATNDGENNFVGVVYRVEFSRDTEDHANEYSDSLIAKVAPQNVARRMRSHSRPGFLREIFMFNKVLPFFRRFEQSKGLTEQMTFHEYPECYRTGETEMNEYVLLEDLSRKNFTMIDKSSAEVTADHVRLVFKSLAKLHAISFALKDQQPEKFVELASTMTEEFLRRDDERMRAYLTNRKERIFNILTREEDAHLLKRVKNLFERECLDVIADCLDANIVGEAAIIIHGDCWQNNMMFRCDSEGKPLEVNLLDWQVARYTSPIIDLVYFLFCCTTKELRDAHYDQFLKAYHDDLSAHIRRLGSDPDKLFPFDLMKEHFHKFARFGLILACFLLPVITADRGNRVNMDEVCENYIAGKPSTTASFITDNSRSAFEKRLRDVVVDMVQMEYI